MKNYIFLKIVIVVLFLVSNVFYAGAQPIITATSNTSTYCIRTYTNITTAVTIADPSNEITEIYIQISAGYVNGQDQLILNNSGSHPKIGIDPFNSSTGKLRLYSLGSATATDFEAAVEDIQFYNSSMFPSGTRSFSITIGQANYLPRNGHYYEFVPNLGITWTDAKLAAEGSNYYGLQGYLATLTAADEAKIAGEQASGAGWIGGSDAETEGVWKWVTGPAEDRVVFWNGAVNGSSPNFSLWNNNEPNQSGNEDYAHITAPGVGIKGSWNDLPNTGEASGDYQPKGYIVEYGGMPGDPVLNISASTTITIPRIESTTPASRCGSGSVTLQASVSNGDAFWYSTPTSTTPLLIGNSYDTPYITTNTTYYVDAGCISNRTAVIASIKTIPTVISTTANSRCDSGTLTLMATASEGNIQWYDSAGNLLATGNLFTTPSITATTTYYVDAIANGCTSPTKIAVIATVNNSPAITSTTPGSRCDSGTVTIGATASAGTLNWYGVATGGMSLATGITFTTPNLTTSTTYYVDATADGCTSPTRTAIVATVYTTPTITSTSPASVCDSGTGTLAATASAGNVQWYDSVGNLLATGNSYATPVISATTTYYVDAIANGCTSPTRTAIVATVNTTPSVTSVTPAYRCDYGTVTLQATASSGNINWYDDAGNLLATGNTFTTPVLDSTTTYFVDAAVSDCKSPKTSITATVYPIDKTNEEVLLCQGETTTLDASISGMNYLWSPRGETTQTIAISTVGEYSVTISSPTIVSCDSQKIFDVIEHPEPIISSIAVEENSITIELANAESYYEYSINGEDFQVSNQFSYIQTGQHTAFVRDNNGCNLVAQDFTIFTIAKFFTPNFDGFNDVWEIREMQDYPNARAQIYDRYGKLIIDLTSYKYSWDGKFNNKILPADDYWYRLKLDATIPELTGHFTLKR